jgi:formate dehydrogenase subunit delta
MDVHNLIDMANRIGEFFESMPDRDEALEGIATHIRRFWEPRMRRAILGAIDQPEPADMPMLPVVREALLRYRERLTPAPEENPVV